jgi:hypothetical protein
MSVVIYVCFFVDPNLSAALICFANPACSIVLVSGPNPAFTSCHLTLINIAWLVLKAVLMKQPNLELGASGAMRSAASYGEDFVISQNSYFCFLRCRKMSRYICTLVDGKKKSLANIQ